MNKINYDGACRHFRCSCGTEMIQIEKDVEYDKNNKETYCTINFSIYLCGITNHEYSLKERLRHIWMIWKHKKPYSDYAILSKAEAHRMGQILLEMTKDVDNEKT